MLYDKTVDAQKLLTRIVFSSHFKREREGGKKKEDTGAIKILVLKRNGLGRSGVFSIARGEYSGKEARFRYSMYNTSYI